MAVAKKSIEESKQLLEQSINAREERTRKERAAEKQRRNDQFNQEVVNTHYWFDRPIFYVICGWMLCWSSYIIIKSF